MKQKGHVILEATKGSIAEELGIESGDCLLEIQGNVIKDVFDYEYSIQEEYLEVLIRKKNGEEWLLEIDKDIDENLGIVFENGFMDQYKTCHNHCIFCFIDQMPEGMRKTLYLKDDDSRLSFLQGNYVTLTNMEEEDIRMICKYHLSPLNISFQTTNPILRCRMLNNRFAGEALKKTDRFYEAGIEMNGQIVLCKGINDKEELDRSINDLMKYLPLLKSVSVVPVGLSKYRDGLYELEPFQKEDAREVLKQIHHYQKIAFQKYGCHFIHASDEWYLLAKEDLPDADTYDGYLQLENGVGMMRLFIEEFEEELKRILSHHLDLKGGMKEELSIATGYLAYPMIEELSQRLMHIFPFKTIMVYPIRNDFFGEQITVSGLLTGQDLLNQLKGKKLGKRLLLSQNLFRSGETVLLDDVTAADLEYSLQVTVDIVKSSGQAFIEQVLKGAGSTQNIQQTGAKNGNKK